MAMKSECLTASELLAEALEKFMHLDRGLKSDSDAEDAYRMVMGALAAAWSEGWRARSLGNSVGQDLPSTNPYRVRETPDESVRMS